MKFTGAIDFHLTNGLGKRQRIARRQNPLGVASGPYDRYCP
jgi:hypothetical protein